MLSIGEKPNRKNIAWPLCLFPLLEHKQLEDERFESTMMILLLWYFWSKVPTGFGDNWIDDAVSLEWHKLIRYQMTGSQHPKCPHECTASSRKPWRWRTYSLLLFPHLIHFIAILSLVTFPISPAVGQNLIINLRNHGGQVIRQKITANTSDDIIELEYRDTDGTIVQQLLDFKSVSIASYMYACQWFKGLLFVYTFGNRNHRLSLSSFVVLLLLAWGERVTVSLSTASYCFTPLLLWSVFMFVFCSLWLFQEVQIIKLMQLIEQEATTPALRQPLYQAYCFVTFLNSIDFISTDSMSKLRQVRMPKSIYLSPLATLLFLSPCSATLPFPMQKRVRPNLVTGDAFRFILPRTACVSHHTLLVMFILIMHCC